MNLQSAIVQLDKEWELDTGFFGHLRNRTFDPDGLQRVVSSLEVIADSVEGVEVLDRKLVSLTWFIPFFMMWQREHLLERGGDVSELDNGTNMVIALLQRTLGVP